MSEEVMKALFLLAGFDVESFYKLANDYWPDHPDYADIRRDSPWWLVKTKYGLIKIGNRKRVTVIDWSDTQYQDEMGILTNDSVTKTTDMVHAWTVAKTLEYLTALRCLLETPHRVAQHSFRAAF